ncbi:MAG: hypothetical protein ACRYG7_35300 [Janthinobacterium lividum]
MALTYTQESDFRQERDFGQKISATFEFMGAHWRPLGRAMLYLVAPVALAQGVLTALVQSRVLQSMGSIRQVHYGAGGSNGVLAAQRAAFSASVQNPFYYLSIVLSGLLASMLILCIYGYVVCCLRPATAAPAEITPADVWAVAKQRIVGTFFSLYGVFIIIGVGFLVLFIPGMYLSIALSLFFVVSMVEGTGFFATMSRCLTLTRGKWWSTFGVIFIMIVLLYLLIIGFTIVLGLLGASMRGAFVAIGESPGIFAVVIAAVGTLFSLLLYPPLLLVLAFQYFNLVERHDGVGLHHLVGQLGQAPLACPGSTSYHPTEEGEY